MEHLLTIVTDVGFPIAVTFYLLHRIETKMNLLIESIHHLPREIHSLQVKEEDRLVRSKELVS